MTSATAAETFAGRDRFLDAVRGASILAVVVGHWLVTQFVWRHGTVELVSALGVVPAMWPLTWLLQVIPLFFFVGGYANRHSWESTRRHGGGYAAFVDRRVSRLLRPTGAFLAAVTVWSVIEASTRSDVLGAGGRIMLQPLWFLGIYVAVIAVTPITVAWHHRWGWWVVAGYLAVVAITETVRLGVGQGGVAYVNVFVVWAMAHQLGYLYADGRLTRWPAAAMAAGGLAVAGTLVATGIYPARMVGVPGDRLVNMNPPTAALTALAIGQVGVAVLIRAPLDRWLQRPRAWTGVVAVNLSVMSIYLWHQVALAAVARVGLPMGLPQPRPGTAWWWLSRPLWFGLAGGVLLVTVMVVARFERRPAGTAQAGGRRTGTAAATALVLLAVGLLALAGTDSTRMLAVHRVLRVLDVAPVLGLACVAVAAWIVRQTRRGERAAGRAVGVGAGAFAVVGIAYAVGVPPVPHSLGLSELAGGIAALLAIVCASGWWQASTSS